MKKRLLFIFSTSVLLFSFSVASAQVTIKTDHTWRCLALPQPNTPPPYPSTNSFSNPSGEWTTANYSDDDWTTEIGIYNDRMWAKTENQDWAACFRRTFTLKANDIKGFHTLQIQADNFAEVWINGHKLINQTSWPIIYKVCVPIYCLNVGNNVIAIKAGEYINKATWVSVKVEFGQLSLPADIFEINPEASIKGNTVINAGSSTTLTAYGEGTYRWSTGATSAEISATEAGNYSVTITDEKGCSAHASTTVTLLDKPSFIQPQIIYEGSVFKIENLQFAKDSAIIEKNSFQSLDELYQLLMNNPSMVIEIGGHTNRLASDQFSKSLSIARARAVADYLADKGIARNRMKTVGYGKTKPLSIAMNEMAHSKNQRVEIKILDIKGATKIAPIQTNLSPTKADSMRKVAEFNAYKMSLQPEIDSLQKLGNQLYKKITPIDHSGLWVGFAYGKTNERYQHDWKIDTSCDCNGSIISIDTSFEKKNRAKTASFQVSYRFAQSWAVRGSGRLSWLDVAAGSRVEGENGAFAQLNKDYQFRQTAANLSLIYYLGNKKSPFRHRYIHPYFGAGIWGQHATMNSVLKSYPKSGTSETQDYVNSKMGAPESQQRTIQPLGFLGLRMGRYIQVAYEWGWHQRYYNELSISIPLNKNVKKSVAKHIAQSQDYDKVDNGKAYYLNLINQKERALFPERFIVKPSKPDNSGSNNGGGGGGGSSGGGSCGSSKS